MHTYVLNMHTCSQTLHCHIIVCIYPLLRMFLYTDPTTTCSAMRYIEDAIDRDSCYFSEDHNCSVLTCPIQAGLDLTIRILRCAHPPAMRVTFGSGFQTVIDHTFDHSEIIPGPTGASINVTVDQLCPSDIGFQVNYFNCAQTLAHTFYIHFFSFVWCMLYILVIVKGTV